MSSDVLIFKCSEGHELSARKVLTKCPGYRHGSPCRGTVKQVGGKGLRSRKEKQPVPDHSEG